ncbi:MAG: hypothetical protein V4850_19705 [Myxococcota bacterium]
MLTLTLLASHLLVADAHASVYIGNPALWVHVDRPAHDFTAADVLLEGIEVHYCGGGSTEYPVDEIIDPVAGWGMEIGGGNLCGVTFHWDSVLVIDGTRNGTSFSVGFGNASANTYVPIGSTIWPVALTPVQVLAGTFPAGSPLLLMTLD